MTTDIRIGKHTVGLKHPTYFIADIAANHDGDLGKAKELIYSCAEAGANAAKFQNFAAETIVSDFGFKSMGSQVSHQAKWKKSVFEVYRDASIPLSWCEPLKETCEKAGIDYFTSPYSLELVQAVEPYITAYKLGSGDVTWHAEIEAMAKTGKPLIIATGASTMEEVRMAVNTALKHSKDLILMQCNTNYTANLTESSAEKMTRLSCINLKVLETFAKEFPGISLGLSDHTHGSTTVLGAVGLYNCRSVEKHYTLDNNMEGPDHPFSMNPETWRTMVNKTRELESVIRAEMSPSESYQIVENMVDDRKELEASIGDGIKRLESNEKDTVVLQRRSLRATRNLKAGEVVKASDFFPLRPCPQDALPPYELDNIIGKILTRDIPQGDVVKLADLSESSEKAA